MMNLQRNARLVGALLMALALYATPALAQDGGDEIPAAAAAPAPAPAPVEAVNQPPAPAPEAEQPAAPAPVDPKGEIDEGTKKVLEGIERLAGDLGLANKRLADNAKALRTLGAQMEGVIGSGLAVNLSVRANLDVSNQINGKVDEIGHGVSVNRDALGAALTSLARLEDNGGRNCSGNGVCFLGRCFCAARLEETTGNTLEGVEAANAKLDLVLGGGDDGAGLSDIFAAADAAAKGGDKSCPGNCSNHGVCRFGACFASAEGIDETIGTVNASVAEVNEALSQQGQLAEINAGTLSGIREEVAGLQGQLESLRIGLDRNEAERAQIRAEKRIGSMIAGPPGDFDITTAAADAEIAVRLVGEQLAAYGAVRERLEARAANGNRRAQRRARRLLADFDQSLAQATAIHAAAIERLGSGDALGAFLAAKASGNPLHQCAQVTIQVDLGELADVDFE